MAESHCSLSYHHLVPTEKIIFIYLLMCLLSDPAHQDINSLKAGNSFLLILSLQHPEQCPAEQINPDSQRNTQEFGYQLPKNTGNSESPGMSGRGLNSFLLGFWLCPPLNGIQFYFKVNGWKIK